MAARKYYCVRKGKITGVFDKWEDCRASINGYSGSEYKGFTTIEEAKEYLGEQFYLRFQADSEAGQADNEARQADNGNGQEDNEARQADNGNGQADNENAPQNGTGQADNENPPQSENERPEKGNLLAYVDGSYDDSLKKYAFGCVFLLPDGRIFTTYGNGDNEKSLRHRNVTGEMLGAMYAVKFAMLNGFEGVELCYDYQGIEKWVTGEWRTKTELTGEYAAYMRKWGQRIQLRFRKVAAHTNVYYNELADKMAKTGLIKGNGVPKVCRVEDMEEYHGTDAVE